MGLILYLAVSLPSISPFFFYWPLFFFFFFSFGGGGFFFFCFFPLAVLIQGNGTKP